MKMYSGRSEEAAEVVFQRREDAMAAMKTYNNLALDSKPMKIELVENSVSNVTEGRILSSGIRQAQSFTRLLHPYTVLPVIIK